jgi:hypothetical protein
MAKLAPIMDPRHNLRQICKELCLLEDHLAHPELRCKDCIRKHFLKVEAYADEAVQLDKTGKYKGVAQLAPWFRTTAAAVEAGADKCAVAQRLRIVRKSLQPLVAAGSGDGPATLSLPPAVRVSSTKAVWLAALAALAGIGVGVAAARAA